jgi:hypothetical protein
MIKNGSKKPLGSHAIAFELVFAFKLPRVQVGA